MSRMITDLGQLIPLFVLGTVAAVLALLYFLFRGLQQDYEAGEYHFTWGVGIVVLFVLGLAPGFVGLGLYLTIEKGYPLYWLVLGLLFALVIGALGLSTATEVSAMTAQIVAI